MTLMPTYGPTRRNTGSPCISNELKESLMDDKNIDFTFYMRCLCSDQMNPVAYPQILLLGYNCIILAKKTH